MFSLKKRSLLQTKILWHIKFWLFYLKTVAAQIRPQPSPKTVHKNNFIDYYCKINETIHDIPQYILNDINLTSNTGYSYDFYRVLIKFPKSLRFNYLWGDVIDVPSSPTFVKSRPIFGDNAHAILLPLNTRRHLRFINDPTPYQTKKSMAVWRGAAYQNHRRTFLEATKNLPFCDVADTSRNALKQSPSNYLSIKEQLQYKIIFSIEGNDVATNLKWIMSSNSLCFTLPLIYETWFREGALIPDVHYVEIKPDFSDIEEKFNYYMQHPDKAEVIIKNAIAHVAEFKDLEMQYQIAQSVVHKYFRLTQQL